jgi:hypothetical protein
MSVIVQRRKEEVLPYEQIGWCLTFRWHVMQRFYDKYKEQLQRRILLEMMIESSSGVWIVATYLLIRTTGV